MARIVCCGEAMVELSPAPGGAGDGWRLGHGGDTLNTAIHLARLGHDVSYLTALGRDPFSAVMIAAWQAEGLDTSLVLRHPHRHAGLYAIATDAAGERSFTYWRGESAARDLFVLADAEVLDRAVAGCDLFCHSLISLAILPPPGRAALLDLAGRVRAGGGRIAFDGNYRARLWESAKEARYWRDAAAACADFGLPTLDDERQLSGAGDADAVAARWQAQGCGEVVVKMGSKGCRLPDGTIAAPPRHLHPVDTSGAGDAFDAGYLAARLAGNDAAEAARAGHELAGWTIMRRGAIPQRGS